MVVSELVMGYESLKTDGFLSNWHFTRRMNKLTECIWKSHYYQVNSVVRDVYLLILQPPWLKSHRLNWYGCHPEVAGLSLWENSTKCYFYYTWHLCCLLGPSESRSQGGKYVDLQVAANNLFPLKLSKNVDWFCTFINSSINALQNHVV